MRDIEWQVEMNARSVGSTTRITQSRIYSGATVHLRFSYANRNRYSHQINNIWVEPTWDPNHRYEKSVDVEVDSMSEEYLLPIQLDVPRGVAGNHGIKFGVNVRGHNQYSEDVTPYTEIQSQEKLPLNINSKTYDAFVSRSNDPKDVETCDRIQNKIREWEFETHTLFSDVDQPVEWIMDKILDVDCLFGIAVPRYQTVEGERPQFHYLDGETGAALARELPVVIFKSSDVDLKGIPNECMLIEFHDPDEETFEKALASVIPQVRRAIQQNRQTQFVKKALQVGSVMATGVAVERLGLLSGDSSDGKFDKNSQ